MDLLQKLLNINEFLLEAKNSYFHVSKSKNEKSILEKGLLGSMSGSFSDLSLDNAIYFTKDVNRFIDAFEEFQRGKFTIFRLKEEYKRNFYFYDDTNEPYLIGTCFYTKGDVPPEALEVVGYVIGGEIRLKY